MCTNEGPIDEVEALKVAKTFVLEHGPSYWEPSFLIHRDREEGVWYVHTGANGLGGDAVLTIHIATGRVVDSHFNPL